MQRPGSPTGAGGKADSCSFLMIVTNARRKDSPGFPHSRRECPRLLSCRIAQLLVVVFKSVGQMSCLANWEKGKQKLFLL